MPFMRATWHLCVIVSLSLVVSKTHLTTTFKGFLTSFAALES